MPIKTAKMFENAKIPTRKHKRDAGIDLYYFGNDFNLEPFTIKILPTGIKIKIPEGSVGVVEDKSRNDFIILGRIVDDIYQGEILVKVGNFTKNPIGFRNGMAIAQLVIYSDIIVEDVEEVPEDKLFEEETDRGATGGIVTQYVGSVRTNE